MLRLSLFANLPWSLGQLSYEVSSLMRGRPGDRSRLPTLLSGLAVLLSLSLSRDGQC